MHKKKIVLLGVILLAAVLVLSGCKSASEKAAEKAIEGATNGQADVDISTNTVTVNYNGGSYQAGGNVSLPDGFPSDVYIIDGTMTAAMTTNQSNGYTVSIDTSKTVNEVKTKYESELRDDGWTISSSTTFQDSMGIFASKGNRYCNVGASLTSGKVTAVITTYTDTTTNTNIWDTPTDSGD